MLLPIMFLFSIWFSPFVSFSIGGTSMTCQILLKKGKLLLQMDLHCHQYTTCICLSSQRHNLVAREIRNQGELSHSITTTWGRNEMVWRKVFLNWQSYFLYLSILSITTTTTWLGSIFFLVPIFVVRYYFLSYDVHFFRFMVFLVMSKVGENVCFVVYFSLIESCIYFTLFYVFFFSFFYHKKLKNKATLIFKYITYLGAA